MVLADTAVTGPLFAFDEVTALIGKVFVYEPTVDAVKSTCMVHEPAGGMMPPLMLSVPDPAAAVAVPAHVLARLGVAAFCRLAG